MVGMMNPAAVYVGVYGALTLAGGIMGYVKAKSRASLVAGTVCGVALLVCGQGINKGNQAAAAVTLAIALVLGGRFFGTWRRTHRLIPDLVMVIFSLASFAIVGLQLFGQ